MHAPLDTRLNSVTRLHSSPVSSLERGIVAKMVAMKGEESVPIVPSPDIEDPEADFCQQGFNCRFNHDG